MKNFVLEQAIAINPPIDSIAGMGIPKIDWSGKETGNPTLALALAAPTEDKKSGRPCKYMDFQVDIDEEMRSILAARLIEVHHSFGLMPETLYLTVHIIEQYRSKETVSETDLLLVGVIALLIASKYEQSGPLQMEDFVDISERAYTKVHILAKEKAIVKTLKWNLSVPMQYVSLVRFLKAAMSQGLMHNSMLTYCPSLAAASAVYAARCTLEKKPLWIQTLMQYTGYSEQQLWRALVTDFEA
ncbi:hypothetical protein OPV22_024648 [Ensete ventricosum]|uniref:Cyclin-like domain-containing protein n=1 Tax=Ensete ventricosum TaxID=4639 RepID=A0AAV8Q7M5_ENSVE|nr:hypothetical protein OPV22_024648 [Ensete ventricosum]